MEYRETIAAVSNGYTPRISLRRGQEIIKEYVFPGLGCGIIQATLLHAPD